MPKKAAGGRPSIEVSDRDLQVIEKMAGLGSTLDQIARVLTWSPATLDRKLKLEPVREAYDRGRAAATHEMASRLWDIAHSNDDKGIPTRQAVIAAIFWLKSQAKWSESPSELSSSVGSVSIYLPDNGRLHE